MEDNREAIEQNTEESIETKAEDTTPAAENVVDDDIQYTFVVPKGEVYRDPDSEEPEGIPEPVMVEPEPAEEPQPESTATSMHAASSKAISFFIIFIPS